MWHEPIFLRNFSRSHPSRLHVHGLSFEQNPQDAGSFQTLQSGAAAETSGRPPLHPETGRDLSLEVAQ
jgi:hypothetical protein